MAEKPPFIHKQQLKQLYTHGIEEIKENYTSDLAILEECNYYTLINSFREPFQDDTRTSKYRKDTSLAEIYALYQFDGALRKLYLAQLLYIEAFIKNIIGYQVAHYFQSHSLDSYKDTFFYNRSNYNQKADTQQIMMVIKEFISIFENKRKITDIDHYKTNHKYIPIWILVNKLSLGKLSKFFQVLPQDLKGNIVILLGQPKNTKHLNKDIEKLEKDLWAFSLVRNSCAHNQRIYNELFANKTRSLKSVFDAMARISQKSPHLQASFKKLEADLAIERRKLEESLSDVAYTHLQNIWSL